LTLQDDVPFTVKYNDLSEIGDSFGAGVKGTVSGNLRVGGNVEQFRSVNKYSQTISGTNALAATMLPPPDITNTMLRLRLYADYALQKNGGLRFDVIHERWSTDDWTFYMFPAGAAPQPWILGGAPNDGTMIISNPKENSTFFGARYIYRFQ
jgi:hypothetical protein